MSSDELFESLSHPLRIEIVKALANKPMRFADLKRHLKVESNGLLDFHLKKLHDLIAINGEGCYNLTDRGFAALTSVESAAKHYRLRSAQKRAFFINIAACIFLNIGALWTVSQLGNYALWYAVVLPVTAAWMLFYGYWTLVKRRIRLTE